MIDFDFDTLRGIGLTQPVLAQLAALRTDFPQGSGLMRITEVQRDTFTLHDGHGERMARALHVVVDALQKQLDALTIGDWVVATPDDAGDLWIAARLAPVTQIARRANDGRRQTLASNVDTALLTMGLDNDFNARRAERYIAMVRACDVTPVVVLTKADIVPDAEARTAQLRARLPASVAIVAVDSHSDDARDALAPWLQQGQTLVLLGSSGAGKSTLTNTLTSASTQATGGQRKGDGRGRHTTTARSLHVCTDGACIVDTPGLRTWRPDTDQASLSAAYDDVSALAPQCRFRDCRHGDEPGCAVRPVVDADRLMNYRKLLRDARRVEQTPLDRIALRRKWKAIGKAGEQKARWKRGDP